MKLISDNRGKMARPGFTLVELLVVISIIGLLSTIATVSYTTARMRARDARRVADLDAVRTALHLYESEKGGFPVDRIEGSEGLILGLPGATKLTQAGWTDVGPQNPNDYYLTSVPSNPAGGGVEYLYYSLNQDGTSCDFSPCFTYRIEYALESELAGTGRAAGAYILDPSATFPASPKDSARILARAPATPINDISARLLPAAQEALRLADMARQATVANPVVESAAETVVAPVSTAAVAVSTITGISSLGSAMTTVVAGAGAAQSAISGTASAATAASAASQLGALVYLLFTQPLLLLRKRKEYAWGVVYDSQKKLPLDLAIVRLVDDQSGRVLQTRVTDRAGRIFFFAGKGTYRIEASKAGFSFPSALLAGEREDGHFANLYFGQKFSVSGDGQVINPSIPLDPAGADQDDKEFIKRFVRGKLRYSVSLLGLVLTMVAFAVKPTWQVAALFAVNVILYYVFRRLSYPKPPAQWGVVKDEKTGRPISHAVVRLFSAPYNKLVETKVSDSRGRYNFLVGQNVYFLTATSKGYWKTESFPLDLRSSEKPQIISAPVRLRPLSSEAENRKLDDNAGTG